jgi:hypothetical protein
MMNKQGLNGSKRMKGIPATKVFLSGIGQEHKCPHCGHLNNSLNSIHLCGSCHTKWWKTNKGNYIYEKKELDRNKE